MKVLLVTLTRDTREIEALVQSAGHTLTNTVFQARDVPDRRFFVGKGKLDEIEKQMEGLDVDLVLFNGELHPSQHYTLEKRLGKECYDRLRLILEIFAERAHSREAKLQVELALLHYEVPILREWIHSAAIGERPGFMAGGEYRVDVYLETVKRRQRRIEDELEVVRRERGRRRASRKDRGFHHVSLAGYANAGKSSMLNALTGERVLVEERMFSTLSTTTRALPGVRRRVLLTDTVGFVDQVPFWMVEAFNSTFEEIYESDLILLLVDASDPEPEVLRKVRLAARTLLPRVTSASILPVLTKADLLSPERQEEIVNLLAGSEFHVPPVLTSTKTGAGLAGLVAAIAQRFALPVELVLHLPAGPEGAAALS
jgi:GTP-binding protein HflX